MSNWLSVDPLIKGEYLNSNDIYHSKNLSVYSYAWNNPINVIDPTGEKILFVNGHWQRGFIGQLLGSSKSGKGYWGSKFETSAQRYFNDYSAVGKSNYIDGSSKVGFDSSGKQRFKSGYKYAKKNIEALTSDLKEGETFKIVTHSEGSAYGAGVAEYLIEQGYTVEAIVHLSADEGDEFSTPEEPKTTQFSYKGDWITGNKKIRGVDKEIIKDRKDLKWDTVHGTTKGGQVFNEIKQENKNKSTE